MFNIVVDVVVRAVLEEVCSLQEEHHGMGCAVGDKMLYLMRMAEGYQGGIMSGYRML